MMSLSVNLFFDHFQPSYGEFDISGNVLGLVFNQGMIWYELYYYYYAHTEHAQFT